MKQMKGFKSIISAIMVLFILVSVVATEVNAENFLDVSDADSDKIGNPVNTLEGVSPVYLGENFVAWIRQAATGNYITDVGGNLYASSAKFDGTQMWHFIYNADDGSYSIHNELKMQYIDVPFGEYKDNAGIWLCDYNGLDPQRFYIYFTRGYFFFKTVGSDRVFDVNSFNFNRLELCGNDTGTTELSFNSRAFDILKFNNDYSYWYHNLGNETPVFIRNSASGLMLTAEGYFVSFKEATYSDNQKWIMSRLMDGSYEIKSVSTGLCLDVLYGEIGAGTTVNLFDRNGFRAQNFYVLPNEQSYGSYYIKPCYTNTVCHMDSATLGLTLQDLNKSDWNSINAQSFEIITEGIVNNQYKPAYIGNSFYAYLTGNVSNNTLTDMGNGEVLAQQTTKEDNQLFFFEYDANTLSYKITGDSGKCLDVSGGMYSDASLLSMSSPDGRLSQKFRVYEIDGWYYISPYTTNRLVDVSSINGETVQLYGTDLLPYRAFSINKVEAVTKELILNNDSDMKITDGFLFEVKANQTETETLSQFKNNNLEIRTSDGRLAGGNEKVGTGYKVNLLSNGKVVDTATIITFGDLTGEGIVDATDYLRIKSVFLATLKLDSASILAADIDGSGKIDTTDYLRVKGYFLKTFDMFADNSDGLSFETMEVVASTPATLCPIFEGKPQHVDYAFDSADVIYDKSKNEFTILKGGLTVEVTAKTAYQKVKFKIKSVESPEKVTVSDVNAFIGYPESDFYPHISNPYFQGKFTYSYDESALEINAETNTVKALKEGTYTVTGTYKNFTFTFNVVCHVVNIFDGKYNADEFTETATKNAERWESSAVDGSTTLFIGDSYFDDPFWSAFYNDDYFGTYDALRLGICSTTTYHWERYLIDGWLKNTTISPKNIVMHIGTNNVLDHIEGPNASQVIVSLQRWFTVLHARFPDAKIYWFEITQRYPANDRIVLWDDATKIINAEMKKWCEERDYITFIDTFGNVVPPKDYFITFFDYFDDTHLNDTGYRFLVDALMKTDIQISKKK